MTSSFYEEFERICGRLDETAMHIAHVVFSDANVDDGSIAYAKTYAIAHREVFKRDHPDVTDEQIDDVIAALDELAAIPEEQRTEDDADE